MGAGTMWRKGRVLLLAALGACALSGCSGMSVDTTWSPDNTHIAYGSGLDKLSVYDVATKQSKETAVGGEVGAPSWSPDGKTIAFYAEGVEKSKVDLQVMSTESGQVRTVVSNVWKEPAKPAKVKAKSGRSSDEDQPTGLLSFLVMAMVSWSPDSARLVCMNSAPTEGGALLVDVASGEVTPMMQGRHTILKMSWSPDGRRIAYLETSGLPAELEAESNKQNGSLPGAVCNLGLYDVKAGASSTLCSFPQEAWALGVPLEWSADSGEVGFIQNDLQHQGRAIGCVIEAKPGARVRPSVRGITSDAAWAPGLRGLVFVEDREDGQVVLLYRGVTPPVRKVIGEIPDWPVEPSGVTESPSRSLPGFSRDGRKIAILQQLNESDTTRTRVLTFDVP